MFLLPIFFIALLIELSPTFSITSITTFTYTSFPGNGIPNISLSGDARQSSQGVIDLTFDSAGRGLNWSVGTVSYAYPIRLHDQVTGRIADFSTHFTFIIDSSINKTYRGEGLTFFLARANWTLPEDCSNQWLGLVNSTLNKEPTKSNQIVAVEFDTQMNYDVGDPSGNHMGIDVNSVISKVTTNWAWDNTGKLNGEAWVSYESTTQTLFARMTNKNLQPYTEWNVSWRIDFSQFLPEHVLVGFTASTGKYAQINRLSSWNFTLNLTTPDSRPTKRAKSLILVLCLVVLILGAIGTIAAMTMIRKRISMNGGMEEEEDEGEDDEGTTDFGRGPRRFRYADLAEATKCFSEEERLGGGGFGSVYRGVLKDTHEVVAVKRLSKGSRQGKKEYISEVTAISQLRHRNLVRLIGWCHERCERLLVYEYNDGGSLDSHLFAPKTDQVLSWVQRMKIALDVASALLYLHEEWVQCVLHRDIKTSNVMIDSNFNARLGDFGLARLVDHGCDPQTTAVAGTMGYIAPECVMRGKVGKESDVYSFGMVLLEIACGRRAWAPVDEKETLLVEWLWELYGSGALLEAIDQRLGSIFNREEAECMMVVGLWCISLDKESRPTMKEAIRTLNFHAELPTLLGQSVLPECV